MLVGTRADAGRASAALAARDLRLGQGRWGSREGSKRAAAGRERGSQSCALILPLPQGLELSPPPSSSTCPHLALANFQAPGNEPGGVEGNKEEKGLNGRVGGFAGGCAANGLSARRRKGPIPPLTQRVASFLLSPLWGSLAFLFGRGGAGSLGKVSALPPPPCLPVRGPGNDHLLGARPLSPPLLRRLRGAGRQTPSPCAFCALRTFRSSERRGWCQCRRAFGRAAVTKSRRGGGEAAELALTPHPAREEEQFVYLGLQESFPPPCSPWPLLPALPLLRAPAQSRQQRPPPILLSLPGLPLHPTPPALPPLPFGTRPWGREREALCPPCGPAQPRGPPCASGPAPSSASGHQCGGRKNPGP